MKRKIGWIVGIALLVILLSSNQIWAVEMPNLEVDSPSAILIEAKTGRVLYEKEADTKRYPASTTKMMTALLTLEHTQNLQEKTIVSYNAIFSMPKGYATDLLKVGEELTIEELLYALLVKSSNEAAVVLAEYVAGSVESFSSMMNTKAAELGCSNTNFINPNGVQDEKHYTTARDLAIIAKEAMKQPEFRKFVSTASHTLPSTNKYERTDRNLITTNDMIRKSSKNYYEYAIGIKTGFTSEAKNCLVAGASKEGVELIAVVLKAEEYNADKKSMRYQDTKNLFEYVYNNFSQKEIVKQNASVKEITVKNGTKDTKKLKLLAKNSIDALVTNDKINETQQGEVTLKEDIKAPIAKDTVLGTVKYTIDGVEYQTDLVAQNDVKQSFLLQIVLGIIAFVFVLYLLSCFMKPRKKQKRKKKNKYVKTIH